MAVNTLVFVNMNSFLTTDELERIYEFAFYNKTNLVMIENQKCERLNSEEVALIDKDMCVIKY
jgi:CRISPR type II-A-associated protein Csn2